MAATPTRPPARFAILAVLAALVALVAPASAPAATVTQSFGCGYNASTAPVGAVSAQFSLNGAAGGNGVNGGSGGVGADVTFTMPVSGGQSFGLQAGCTGGQAANAGRFGGSYGSPGGGANAGQGYWGGGNGGGATFVTSLGGSVYSGMYAIAAGGGGGGGGAPGTTGGSGGDAGSSGSTASSRPVTFYGTAYGGGGGGSGLNPFGGSAGSSYDASGGWGASASGAYAGPGGGGAYYNHCNFGCSNVGGGGGGGGGGGYVGGGGGAGGGTASFTGAGGGGGGGGRSLILTGAATATSITTLPGRSDGSVSVTYTIGAVAALTPASPDFGPVTVGQNSDAQTFTLTNSSPDTAMTVGTVDLSGANASSFQLADDHCSGQAVPADGTCTVTVTFAPDAPGAQNATLSVPSDAGNGTQTAALTGTGTAPAAISVSPNPHDFGTHNLNSRTDQTFTVTNTGDNDLHVDAVDIQNSGGQFGLVADGVSDECTGQTVAAGANCTFKGTFVPHDTGAGLKTATFTVTSDAANGTASIPVQGSVAPGALHVAPASYDFGDQPFDSPATHTFVVSNSGGSALSVTNVATAGNPDFAVADDSCSGHALDPGASCTVDARFMPNAFFGAGPQSDDLHIDADVDSITVALSGTALTPPEATVSPSPNDFGAHVVGTRTDQAFTIINTGGSPLNIQGIDDNDSDDFDAGPAGSDQCTGHTVAAGDTCTFVWSFTPPADAGAKSTSLHVDSNDPDAPTLVPVTGQALDPSHISITPDPLDFATVPTGDTADQTVTVTNSGDVPMTVGQAALSFTNADQYALLADDCSGQTVAGGDTCTIDVRYSPTADGDAFAVLTVPSDADSGQHEVNVLGMGQTPAAPTVSSPADGQTVTDSTPDVVITTQPGMSVHLLVDHNDDEGYKTAGSDGTATFTLAAPLGDGDHELVVFARSGPHTTSPERSSTFTLDTATPAGPAMSTGPQGATSERTARFEFSGETGASFSCALDDGAFAPCTSPQSYHDLGDGPHTFRVRQTDAAGHIGATSTQTFTVDTAAPAEPAVTTGPQGTTSQGSARFEFSGEAGASFACALDDGAFAPCTSPQSYQALAAGPHTFRVRQTDAAGHAGATSTQTFTVSSTATTTPTPGPTAKPTPAPTAKPTATADATSLKLVVAAIGTTEHAKVPVGCRLDAGQLATCTVRAYAGHQRVGTGAVRFAGGRLGTVNVRLSGRELRRMRRLHGVRLTYRGVATTATGARLAAAGRSRVLPLRVAAVPHDGLFRSGQNTLTGYGRRFVASLAAQLDGAKRVTCIGHTDSVGTAAANRRLGRARAKVVCRALRKAGGRARLRVRSAGESGPRATNRTAAGRALNRRVELLVRYR